MWLRMTPDFRFSCLYSPNAGTAGALHSNQSQNMLYLIVHSLIFMIGSCYATAGGCKLPVLSSLPPNPPASASKVLALQGKYHSSGLFRSSLPQCVTFQLCFGLNHMCFRAGLSYCSPLPAGLFGMIPQGLPHPVFTYIIFTPP